MEDWQEFAQAIFIGLIFAFLVSKLISLLISFRDAKIRLVREEDLPLESDTEKKNRNESTVDKSGAFDDDESEVSEENLGFTEQQSVVSESLSEEEEKEEDDDDWEGVESTELDEAFNAATTFVAAAAADRLSQKVSNEVQLQLYGFYKIATEGPCRIPQPSALKMSARAKWNAWQRLGSMPPEEAMQKYIVIVNELYPTWASGSTIKKKDGPKSEAKGPMGPVFSSFIYEEDSGSELKLDAIHDSAREGEIDNVLRCIETGVSVNLKDSEGRTPLHWAVDRGHLNVVELLIDSSAHINAKDNEGQTALHYAVVCEREGIAEFLVKHNADIDAKDIDGSSPCDLCELNWPWMCNSSSTEVI